MLRQLRIQNFAILPEATVSFSPGLNVLTGETGAGKSLLVDAITLLAGGRASSEDVRAGEKMASVEGILEMDRDSAIWKVLQDAGVPCSEPEILIRRVISRDGRSRTFVNDVAWTTTGLARIARSWVDISGQHGQQLLLQEENHVEVLDAFGGHDSLREAFEEAYERLREIQEEIERIQQERHEFQTQKDFLLFQLKELEEANVTAENEEEELSNFHRRLGHREKLIQTTRQVEELLDGDQSAGRCLGAALGAVRGISSLDSTVSAWENELDENLTRIRDLSTRVAQYARELDFEPQEIAAVEERLAVLGRIRRKYGSIGKAMSERERIASLVAGMEDFVDRESGLMKEKEKAEQELLGQAKKLGAARKKSGAKFMERVTAELQMLAMPEAQLAVRLSPFSEDTFGLRVGSKVFTSRGGESVRFELAPNPGEGFKALARIVSGGELSRVLLAIKGIAVSDRQSMDYTYLFDEVDSGIGGETAERVGMRLKELARGRQVLCVTHLAQMACYGDVHLSVVKKVDQGRTRADVSLLSPKDRKAELARMLGGIRVSAKALDHAEELLGRGRDLGPTIAGK